MTRRRVVKAIIFGLIFLSAVFFVLYDVFDILFRPPEQVNSTSLPGEWAMFRHDPGHSGTTDSSGSLPRGELKWVFAAGAAIHSSPTVVDGTVYVGSQDSKLYALDAATGAKRWEYKAGSWVESSPTVVGGMVYFGANDGEIYCLDISNGDVKWQFDTGALAGGLEIYSSPAIANGKLYVGSTDRYVLCLGDGGGMVESESLDDR